MGWENKFKCASRTKIKCSKIRVTNRILPLSLWKCTIFFILVNLGYCILYFKQWIHYFFLLISNLTKKHLIFLFSWFNQICFNFIFDHDLYFSFDLILIHAFNFYFHLNHVFLSLSHKISLYFFLTRQLWMMEYMFRKSCFVVSTLVEYIYFYYDPSCY